MIRGEDLVRCPLLLSLARLVDEKANLLKNNFMPRSLYLSFHHSFASLEITRLKVYGHVALRRVPNNPVLEVRILELQIEPYTVMTSLLLDIGVVFLSYL